MEGFQGAGSPNAEEPDMTEQTEQQQSNCGSMDRR